MRIKILGWGEVGKAIGELFSSVDFEIFIQDPAIGFRIDSHEKGFDFLFVCIPYSDSFISEVKNAMGSDIKKVVIF
jgi:predicted dinucleotide-binding enzyme